MTSETSLENYTFRRECRVCESPEHEKILDLGSMPLANSFLSSAKEFTKEKKFPLRLYRCRDCGMLQLLDVVDPRLLFSNYIYVSGTSETMTKHFLEYSREVKSRTGLKKDQLVVEIASNDGSLLRHFTSSGVRVLGIEPAKNIAELAIKRGIPTEPIFFDSEAGGAIKQRHGGADVVIANNVLAHVDNPAGFLEGCRKLLNPDGYVIVEVPYAGEMLDKLEFDTIYHEHLSYFSATSLLRLFETAGFRVEKIDRISVHGGSLRVWAKQEISLGQHGQPALKMVDTEREDDLFSNLTCSYFAGAAEETAKQLKDLIIKIRGDGARVAAYGAPAKGNTLLNYCGLDHKQIDFVADKNQAKVGKFTPGTHIPVLSAEELLKQKPDYTLLLAWNFTEEVLSQQRKYRDAGGRFILPLPAPEIIG